MRIFRFTMVSQIGGPGGHTWRSTGSYDQADADRMEELLTAMRDGANTAGFPTEVHIETPGDVRTLP